MQIRLLESAKEDLRSGWSFYERQSYGLGDYFLDSIQADVRSLLIYAGIHEVSDGFYRMPAKRFPFAIYYQVVVFVVDVYAILDCRSDPNWIVSRLRRSKLK